MTFLKGFPEYEFIEFLTTRIMLEECEAPQPNKWGRLGNSIGSLALRLKLLSESEVDNVLEMQDVSGRYFGEIAVEAGYLSHAQVSALLEIQNLHEQLELGEQLVVGGKLDVATLIHNLYEFSVYQCDESP